MPIFFSFVFDLVDNAQIRCHSASIPECCIPFWCWVNNIITLYLLLFLYNHINGKYIFRNMDREYRADRSKIFPFHVYNYFVSSRVFNIFFSTNTTCITILLVVFISFHPTNSTSTSIPFMPFISSCSTLFASTTIPIVQFVSRCCTTRTLTAIPLVMFSFMSLLATSTTFTKIPMVLLVVCRAAFFAYTSVSFMPK